MRIAPGLFPRVKSRAGGAREVEAIAVLVVIGIVLVAHVLRFRISADASPGPQLLKRRPLSEPEQSFYHALRQALPDHHVLPQVCFSRFLYTRVGQRTDDYTPWSGAEQMVADYLVCDDAFDIVCAIELDEAIDTRNTGQAKSRLLAQAEIRLVKWHVCSLPTDEEVRKTVLEAQSASQASVMA